MKIIFPYLARWKAVNWTRYHSLLTELAKNGHEIHIIQPPVLKSEETNFQDIDVAIPDNIILYEAEVNRGFWERKWPVDKLVKKGYYTMAIAPMVERIINEQGIEVMLAYNLPHYKLFRDGRCLKIFDYADDYADMLKFELGALSNPLILKIGKTLLNNMMKRADITFSVSNVLAKTAVGNVHVLPNGVNLKEAEIHSGGHIPQDYKPPVVGFIGSFEYFIDFDLILNAAKMMPDITFLLVGSGRLNQYVSNQIEQLALNNIILTGGVAHADVFKYIRVMDICLNIFKKLPISHGACPIKLFEYMALKKPVISTRVEEVELIDNHYVYFADTVNELVGTVRKILDNKSDAEVHAARGYEAVVNEYEWGKIAERFVSIVSDYIDAKKTVSIS